MIRHQEPLRGIRQRCARAVNAAVIRRDQAVSIGQAGSGDQPRSACSRQSSGDPFTSSETVFHALTFIDVVYPVIIALTRLRKPPAQTMDTCTTRKRTRKSATTK